MKKIFFVLLLVFFLSACGNESNAVGNSDVEETEISTMEFGNFDNDLNSYTDEMGETYTILDKYKSDESADNGFNEVNFDGYEYKFSVLAVESDSQEYIALVGETENTTDNSVQFNSEAEIITDTQEQAESDFLYAVGKSAPSVVTDAFILIPINRGIPESFSLEINTPWVVLDNGEQGGHIGSNVKMDFHKE
ncbi:lipoprotein [Oceanobacillus neutriphilus]|uniref:DUF4352 domain-containing protein n=1 Tax=Oceanobacillus neutriphilus TaxID=531815 RepID=A0ABQ2P2K5_9BACI|nr:lipoprotein [Oceanobacillus neutriphilus]GGP16471.1 hypothetical protein GCM10011346_48570 [Oceanobacillus neutriphilus]